MACEHMTQYPDKTRRTWVCKDCGAATVAFYTKAERDMITADEQRMAQRLKRIVTGGE